MTHQPAGEADYSDGRLGRLGNIKQVVQQSLVLVVGEQIELVQDEQHRTAAAAIAFLQRIQQESQVLRKTSLKSDRYLVLKQFSWRENCARSFLCKNFLQSRCYSQTLCRQQRFPAGAALLFLSELFCRPSAGGLKRIDERMHENRSVRDRLVKQVELTVEVNLQEVFLHLCFL